MNARASRSGRILLSSQKACFSSAKIQVRRKPAGPAHCSTIAHSPSPKSCPSSTMTVSNPHPSHRWPERAAMLGDAVPELRRIRLRLLVTRYF
ncbi:MAG: hypothetical protein M0C28_03755 [Candidatus Moduliflexus flocculans]|nr:hypothetical protein [Candidatus Moduliflexus flocculans]